MIPARRDVVGGVSIKGAQYKILTEFYSILLKGCFQPPSLAYGYPAYMRTMYVQNMRSKKCDNRTPIFAAGILICVLKGNLDVAKVLIFMFSCENPTENMNLNKPRSIAQAFPEIILFLYTSS